MGWTIIQLKPLTTRDGSNWERKLKTAEVWTSLEIYLKVLNGKKDLNGCAYTKGATSHSHLNSASSILNEKGEQKCWKFQWFLNNTIFRKNSVNHHHLNVCHLKLVDLYIMIINVFGVWKFLTKKVLLQKLENWWDY